MWPAIALGAYVAGSALGIMGDINAANAESDAAEKDAAYKMIQAQETENRAKINMEITQEEGAVLQGEIGSAYAKAGVDVGSGSPLMVMAYEGYKTRRQMANIYSEARFRADMIRAGAQDQIAQAGANRAAATTRAVAGTLKMVGNLGMNMSGKAKASEGGAITGGDSVGSYGRSDYLSGDGGWKPMNRNYHL